MTVVDPTFYRRPANAISAPPETLAYVVAFDRSAQRPDALAVLDTDPESSGYGQVVGWADLPTRGEAFFPNGEAFRGLRVHQVRLQGGDSSPDSYCYR